LRATFFGQSPVISPSQSIVSKVGDVNNALVIVGHKNCGGYGKFICLPLRDPV
jgi:hypothetical protein